MSATVAIQKYYTPERFKENFRVGDVIAGWRGGRLVEITAIGKNRFLYVEMNQEDERVAKMDLVTGWAMVFNKERIRES